MEQQEEEQVEDRSHYRGCDGTGPCSRRTPAGGGGGGGEVASLLTSGHPRRPGGVKWDSLGRDDR